MGLINLKTNLRENPYGEIPITGSSYVGTPTYGPNPPYIVTPIPGPEQGENPFAAINSGIGNFIIRGGALAFVNSDKDVLRLTKFFTDINNPAGLQFIAKQQLLSQISTNAVGFPGKRPNNQLNPNGGFYNPLNTITQAGILAEGIHIPKQGLFPVFNIDEQDTYLGITRDTNKENEGNNRLTILYNTLFNVQSAVNTNPLYISLYGISDRPNEILRYRGGPGSVLGVGNTKIGRYVNTNIKNPLFYNHDQITRASNYAKDNRTVITDFREDLVTVTPSLNLPYTKYDTFNRATTYKIGDPGISGSRDNYTVGVVSNSNTFDAINAKNKFTSSSFDHSKNPDLIKFSIGIVDNDKPENAVYLPFRAYLDDLNESYNSEWNPIEYVGRGDKFYNYGGYTRQVSLGFSIHAQSRQELIPLYQKLNYLISSLTPDYSEKGFMRGNLIRLTVGDYLYDVYGICQGFNLQLLDNAVGGWEINRDNLGNPVTDSNALPQVPHLIRVTGFNFIPLEKFLPEKNAPFITLKNEFNNFYKSERINISQIIR